MSDNQEIQELIDRLRALSRKYRDWAGEVQPQSAAREFEKDAETLDEVVEVIETLVLKERAPK